MHVPPDDPETLYTVLTTYAPIVTLIISSVLIPLVSHYLSNKKIEDVKDKISTVAGDVLRVEKATNGHTELLLEATKQASYAEGMKQEQIEQKGREAEQAKGAADEALRRVDRDTIPPGNIITVDIEREKQ